MQFRQFFRLLLLACLPLACAAEASPGATAGLTVVDFTSTNRPLPGATAAEQEAFATGDARFSAPFHPADGLGPLYIRAACNSCHSGNARGPGFVQKMALVLANSATPTGEVLTWGESVRPLLAGGATTPVNLPASPTLLVTQRLGPGLFGRGYLEAVSDAEILRNQLEKAQNPDLPHGKLQRVKSELLAETDPQYNAAVPGQTGLIGRFGMKAALFSLEDAVSRALLLDIGLTSPLRPLELPNPDHLADDLKPGVDVALTTVHALVDYMRLLEIPPRSPDHMRGQQLFAEVGCAGCHVPSLHTRKDYPIAALADVEAPVYTDFLLHDMGDALADGVVEGLAGPREWKTAPLIGLRFYSAYLHDGRATTIDGAVRSHASAGSAASAWIGKYAALSADDRAELLDFVESL